MEAKTLDIPGGDLPAEVNTAGDQPYRPLAPNWNTTVPSREFSSTRKDRNLWKMAETFIASAAEGTMVIPGLYRVKQEFMDFNQAKDPNFNPVTDIDEELRRSVPDNRMPFMAAAQSKEEWLARYSEVKADAAIDAERNEIMPGVVFTGSLAGSLLEGKFLLNFLPRMPKEVSFKQALKTGASNYGVSLAQNITQNEIMGGQSKEDFSANFTVATLFSTFHTTKGLWKTRQELKFQEKLGKALTADVVDRANLDPDFWMKDAEAPDLDWDFIKEQSVKPGDAAPDALPAERPLPRPFTPIPGDGKPFMPQPMNGPNAADAKADADAMMGFWESFWKDDRGSMRIDLDGDTVPPAGREARPNEDERPAGAAAGNTPPPRTWQQIMHGEDGDSDLYRPIKTGIALERFGDSPYTRVMNAEDLMARKLMATLTRAPFHLELVKAGHPMPQNAYDNYRINWGGVPMKMDADLRRVWAEEQGIGPDSVSIAKSYLTAWKGSRKSFVEFQRNVSYATRRLDGLVERNGIFYSTDGKSFSASEVKAARIGAEHYRRAAEHIDTLGLMGAAHDERIYRANKRITELGNELNNPHLSPAQIKKVRDEYDDLRQYIAGSAKAAAELKAVKFADRTNWLPRNFDHNAINADRAGLINVLRSNGLTLAEANESIQHILDGFDPHTASIGPIAEVGNARSLKTRRLWEIPDAQLEPWLNNDYRLLGNMYFRSIGTKAEMVRMYGSFTLQPQLDAIAKRYDDAAAAAGAGSAQEARLLKEKARVLKDIEDARDMVNFTFFSPEDPSAFLPRLARVTRIGAAVNMLTGLVSDLPNLAMLPLMHGWGRTLPRIMDAAFTSMDDLKAQHKITTHDLERLGFGLETMNAIGLDGIVFQDDPMSNLTKTERTMEGVGAGGYWLSGTAWAQDTLARVEYTIGGSFLNDDIMSLSLPHRASASLPKLAGETDLAHTIRQVQLDNPHLLGDLDKAKLVAKARLQGDRAVNQIDAFTLRDQGIDAETAANIAHQIERWGAPVQRGKSVFWDIGIDDWTDKDAANAYSAAMIRRIEQMRTNLIPGATPTWANTWWGSFFAMFKKFGMSAHNQILKRGLQRSDARSRVIAGLATMVALGGVSEWLAQQRNDRKKSAGQSFKGAMERSGMLGMFFDANNIMEAVTNGNVGIGPLMGEHHGGSYLVNLMNAGSAGFEFWRRQAMLINAGAQGVWNGGLTSAQIRDARLASFGQAFYSLDPLMDGLQHGVGPALKIGSGGAGFMKEAEFRESDD